MLREAVDESPNFDRILQHFGGELGGEARAIVRALLGARRHS